MKRLSRRDVTGEPIKVGDIVRIVGVPDLAGMCPEVRAQSLPVFQHLLGTYKRVDEFDKYGFAWLMFKIRKGSSAGLHTVGIEPYFLRVRRSSSRRQDRTAVNKCDAKTNPRTRSVV